MESKNPVVRLAGYGKLKKMMNTFKHHKLTLTEKNLLRGIFLRKIKDFKEAYKDQIESKSLYQRLKGRLSFLDMGDEQDELDSDKKPGKNSTTLK